LLNGVSPCLAGHGIFEFSRDNRNAVEAEDQIQRVVICSAVGKLPRHSQPIGRIELLCLGIETAGWCKIRRTEELAEAFEAMPENHETAFMIRVQRATEIIEERRFSLVLLKVLEICPFLWLGMLDELLGAQSDQDPARGSKVSLSPLQYPAFVSR